MLKQAFVKAFNRILGDKNRYITQFEELLPVLADTSELEDRLANAQNAHDAAVGRMRRLLEENTRQAQEQEEYERRWGEAETECKDAENFVKKTKDDILEQSARKEKICRYLNTLKQTGDIVTEFDEELWQATVESVTVYPDKSLTLTFRDSTQIPVKMPD